VTEGLGWGVVRNSCELHMICTVGSALGWTLTGGGHKMAQVLGQKVAMGSRGGRIGETTAIFSKKKKIPEHTPGQT